MPQPQQLPGPNADIWDWQIAGLCRGVDSAMFFHPDGERGRARAQREMRANGAGISNRCCSKEAWVRSALGSRRKWSHLSHQWSAGSVVRQHKDCCLI